MKFSDTINGRRYHLTGMSFVKDCIVERAGLFVVEVDHGERRYNEFQINALIASSGAELSEVKE